MNQIRSTGSAAVLVVVAVTLALGCGTSPTDPPGPGAIFQTTQTIYETPAPPGRSIGVSLIVTNPLGRPIYIPVSGGSLTHLEMKVGSTWIVTYQVLFNSVPLTEVAIAPGESRTDYINIDINQNWSPSLRVEAPGVYRAVFLVRGPGPSGFTATSNEFEIRPR